MVNHMQGKFFPKTSQIWAFKGGSTWIQSSTECLASLLPKAGSTLEYLGQTQRGAEAFASIPTIAERRRTLGKRCRRAFRHSSNASAPRCVRPRCSSVDLA